MSILLLKEITLNYIPSSDTIDQLARDYYVMFALWKRAGSGAMAFGGGPEPQKRTEVIDQVFEQVATLLGERIIGTYGESDSTRNLEHYLKMEDWLNFHAEVEQVLKSKLPGSFQTYKNTIETDPRSAADSSNLRLSPIVKKLVTTASQFPKKEKPADTSSPSPKKPTLPQIPTDVPPLGSPMAGNQSKRIPSNWEEVLKTYGYEWDESESAYKNPERNATIKIKPNYTSEVFLPSGNTMKFSNLGSLFLKLEDNKKKRQLQQTEPTAQVTTENYKMLYEFLYV